MEYSIKKGFFKGLQAVLIAVIAVVGVTQFAGMDLWSLAETYVKPFLSGVTVVGGLTMVLNYIKIKNK